MFMIVGALSKPTDRDFMFMPTNMRAKKNCGKFMVLQKNNRVKKLVDLPTHCAILEFVQLIGDYMRGSIRMLVGFMIVFGAIGTIEVNPDADLLVQIIIALCGLSVMLTGVSAMREDV
jgi:hypothetical protein